MDMGFLMWAISLVHAVYTKARQGLMSLHKCWLGRTENIPSPCLDRELNLRQLFPLDHQCSALTTELQPLSPSLFSSLMTSFCKEREKAILDNAPRFGSTVILIPACIHSGSSPLPPLWHGFVTLWSTARKLYSPMVRHPLVSTVS